ncbi:hypothetical protein PM082_017630 [Marasmius tenuissimus]|nr:hypothetical protein PM082_017630 [Marasmius tenuissimus]
MLARSPPISEVDQYRGPRTDDFDHHEGTMAAGFEEIPLVPTRSHSSHVVPSGDETGPADEKQQNNGYSGSQRRLGLIPILPALISSLVVGGMASALLAWVLTRRITSHSSDEDPFFRSAIVVAEGRQSGITKFLGQMLWGEQNATAETEATMYALAMSSVAVHTVSFTMPLALGVFGYCLAARWIRSQERQHKDGLPTPTQYGLVVSLLGSPNFISAYDAISYISRKRRTRPAVPTTLALSLMAVTAFLFVNYALWICDLWFHTTSSTFSHKFFAPISPNHLPLVASVINKTLCSGPVKTLWAEYVYLRTDVAVKYANCLHNVGYTGTSSVENWGTVGLISEGQAIFNNNSMLSQVAVVDNVTVLLPKTMPKDVQKLLFDSFALESECAPVTDCTALRADPKTSPRGQPEVALSCPSFSLNLSTTEGTAMSMVQQFNLSTSPRQMLWWPPNSPPLLSYAADVWISTRQDTGYLFESMINPGGALVTLFWNHLDKATYKYVNSTASSNTTTGWYVWFDATDFGSEPQFQSPYISASFVASCQVTVYNVTVSYSSPSKDVPPSLSLTSKSHADFNTSSAFLGALDPVFQKSLASHISDVLQPSLNTSNVQDYFITALAGNLSTSMLGFTAPLAMRARASEGISVTQLPVSRYLLAPFGALLALLYGYTFISLALCSSAALLKSRNLNFTFGSGNHSQLEIDLVHQRLTSARASIADRFGLRGPKDSDDSITMRNAVFEEEKDTGRLGMGMVREATEEMRGSDGGTEDASDGLVRRKIQQFKVDYIEELGVDE